MQILKNCSRVSSFIALVIIDLGKKFSSYFPSFLLYDRKRKRLVWALLKANKRKWVSKKMLKLRRECKKNEQKPKSEHEKDFEMKKGLRIKTLNEITSNLRWSKNKTESKTGEEWERREESIERQRKDRNDCWRERKKERTGERERAQIWKAKMKE